MADVLFENNASGLLAATITTTSTSIQVASGFGALFPSPSGSQFFYITLEDSAGNIEICKVTARATDILTVLLANRGLDGTTAQAFTLSDTRVELRTTAVVLESFVQVSGDSMAGALDFATNELQNAYLTGTTRITAGQGIGFSLRGVIDQTSNEVVVPTSGRATAGGAGIVVDTDDIVALLDTAGTITLDSATVGVVIPAGAYLQLQGATAANFVRLAHDDTDLNITVANTTEINITGVVIDILSGSLQLNDGQLDQPLLNDFAVQRQAVTATATTALDYTLGQYVELALDASITTFSITDPPITTRYGALRLKITQGTGGSFTIDWTGANVKWPEGTIPTLSTAAAAYDFVDLWTDDAGTTWNGAFLKGFA